MKKTPVIAMATGTRADWGLLHPLAEELRRREADVRIIATNMHLMEECGLTVNEIAQDGFGPDATVPTAGRAADVTSDALRGFSNILSDMKPDLLVVLGDRFEILGAASGALLTGIPIAHIAGGTISEGAFDDSIRHAITKMASLHLVETERCAQRVRQMGENPEDVIVCGALGVYNALNAPLMSKPELETSLGFNLEGKVVLATLHAATLDPIPPIEQLSNLMAALEVMIERENLKIVFTYPNNDVDSRQLTDTIEKFRARFPKNVLAIPSLGRIRYLSLLQFCVAVVGNSSSGLVEVPSVHIPTLDIGRRQHGRECGESVVHCGSSREEIARGLELVLSDAFRRVAASAPNPYFKENTPAIMAATILSREWHPYPQKKFYSI